MIMPIEKSIKNDQSAGGWASLSSSVKHLIHEKALLKGISALLHMNKPCGIDCPGCAWPDPTDHSVTEFCENGVKAIAAETTSKKVTRQFFEKFPVNELLKQDGYWLEQQGRLTEPMYYSRATGHYVPITWQQAFEKIGNAVQSIANPDEVVLYTSGRTSNEAAFLYQLFGRELGTNNFPDCSNMCHESSGVALGESIGTGKGTVSLADFEEADAIFIFGQNPGTNHPRMLTELEKANKRGCQIVSVNPLKEVGLENFVHPQHIGDMLLNKRNAISTHYLQPLIGGDFALLKGLIKAVFEIEKNNPGMLDYDFIKTHTSGLEDLRADISTTSWELIVEQSGISKKQIIEVAELYCHSKNTIACWAMGLTQTKHGVITIQQVVNLLLLKGNIGRPGAGVCPVRGHSNVQGDRTMGIVENPKREFLDALGNEFNFAPPLQHGYNTVDAIKALHDEKVKVFIGMGGNFASATPDTNFTENALGKCGLTVYISTKLNRSHLITGKEALILPCLGRTEMDLQNGIAQKVTVEDSMSMVHTSEGKNRPASRSLLSEPAIVAGIAMASIPQTKIDWLALVGNYELIRNKIEKVLPDFYNFNERLKNPGGFHLRNSAREKEWRTASGKANFVSNLLPELKMEPGQLRLMTIRSHDQYNTTIYGLDDRYRGIKGQRKVIFLNREDMQSFQLNKDDLVDIISISNDGQKRRADLFKAIPYDIPRGCAAAYFPETNVLVPIDSTADKSNTPTSKYIIVELVKR